MGAITLGDSKEKKRLAKLISCNSHSHTTNMPTSDHPSAYDFDFGVIPQLTREMVHLIFAEFTPANVYAQRYPSAQRTYMLELFQTSAVIQDARYSNCGHSVFDWATYLLEVDDFDEFLETRNTEFFDGDNNFEN